VIKVTDILRHHCPTWHNADAGQISLAQLKVMSAVESRWTAALGGHVERCEDCAHARSAHNSCLMGEFSNGKSSAGKPFTGMSAMGRERRFAERQRGGGGLMGRDTCQQPRAIRQVPADEAAGMPARWSNEGRPQ
jgi:hypothetical protein